MYTAHLRGYTARLQGERERCNRPRDLAFISIEGRVSRVSQIHSLLTNLKHMTRNWGAGREKQVTQAVM